MDHINGMPVRRWLVRRVKALVVLDRRALEEVCLLKGDHGLLPAAAGEGLDRLGVFPDGDVDVGAGRCLEGSADMLRQQSGLPRHERDSGVSKKDSNSASLPRWMVGLKTRMIMGSFSPGFRR